MTLSGETIYFAVSSPVQITNRLVAISSTGQVTATNFASSDQLYSLATIGEAVYLGGSFSKLGEASGKNLAAVKADGTIYASWRPDPTHPPERSYQSSVSALAASGDTLYT
jgi:hypothetical protein